MTKVGQPRAGIGLHERARSGVIYVAHVIEMRDSGDPGLVRLT